MCERNNEQELKEERYAWRWIQQKLWQWALNKTFFFSFFSQIIFYTLSIYLFLIKVLTYTSSAVILVYN